MRRTYRDIVTTMPIGKRTIRKLQQEYHIDCQVLRNATAVVRADTPKEALGKARAGKFAKIMYHDVLFPDVRLVGPAISVAVITDKPTICATAKKICEKKG